MSAIFFSILTIFSLFVFMNLGKIKASKKQTDRNDRINWSRKRGRNFYKKKDGSKIIEGSAEEVNENTEN